jgi:hypothetical protein
MPGKLFSPAMGCRYGRDCTVSMVFEQRRLSKLFNSDILRDAATRSPYMAGRTAVFQHVSDAEELLDDMWLHDAAPGATFAVVEAEVSVDVMEGSYRGARVFAGRRVAFGPAVRTLWHAVRSGDDSDDPWTQKEKAYHEELRAEAPKDGI